MSHLDADGDTNMTPPSSPSPSRSPHSPVKRKPSHSSPSSSSPPKKVRRQPSSAAPSPSMSRPLVPTQNATVFVSYAWADGDAYRDAVLGLAAFIDALDGFEVVMDEWARDRAQEMGLGLWMAEAVEQAAWVLVLVTPEYADKLRDVGLARGRGVRHEMRMITTLIRQEQGGKVIPVMMTQLGAQRGHVPFVLQESWKFRWPAQTSTLVSVLQGESPRVQVMRKRGKLQDSVLREYVATLRKYQAVAKLPGFLEASPVPLQSDEFFAHHQLPDHMSGLALMTAASGYGKSSAMKFLALRQAERTIHDRAACLPVLVEARELAKALGEQLREVGDEDLEDLPGVTFDGLFTAVAGSVTTRVGGGKRVKHATMRVLAMWPGRCVQLLVDAVDEVQDPEVRHNLLLWLHRASRKRDWEPDEVNVQSFVVSSRHDTLPDADTVIHLEELPAPKSEEFVRRVLHHAQQLPESHLDAVAPVLRRLRRTPLLLVFAASFVASERPRRWTVTEADLYEHIVLRSFEHSLKHSEGSRFQPRPKEGMWLAAAVALLQHLRLDVAAALDELMGNASFAAQLKRFDSSLVKYSGADLLDLLNGLSSSVLDQHVSIREFLVAYLLSERERERSTRRAATAALLGLDGVRDALLDLTSDAHVAGELWRNCVRFMGAMRGAQWLTERMFDGGRVLWSGSVAKQQAAVLAFAAESISTKQPRVPWKLDLTAEQVDFARQLRSAADMYRSWGEWRQLLGEKDVFRVLGEVLLRGGRKLYAAWHSLGDYRAIALACVAPKEVLAHIDWTLVEKMSQKQALMFASWHGNELAVDFLVEPIRAQSRMCFPSALVTTCHAGRLSVVKQLWRRYAGSVDADEFERMVCASWSSPRLLQWCMQLDEMTTHLRKLDLSQVFGTAPSAQRRAALARATGLRYLSLHGGKFVRVDEVCEAKSLERLDLAYNCLQRLPSLDKLPRLRRLDAPHNQLTAIGASLTGLPLQRLDLSGNELSNLHELARGLVDNRVLKVLRLSHNRITNVRPLQSVLTTCTALHELDLSRNLITIASPLACAGPALHELNLFGNVITDASAFHDTLFHNPLFTLVLGNEAFVSEDVHELVSQFGSDRVYCGP